jgi:exopolyphosphatase/guanosine-5'-triphosphate,3'-diphosphate pyrophosphatase
MIMPSAVRCACVDIGSNTTRLLVAEVAGGTLHEVRADRVFTRTLRGCGPDGTLAAPKVEEVAAVVAQHVAAAIAEGADRIRVVGTAAIRRAPNRDVLLRAVRERAGVEVDVLSGEEEARLAFAGATAGLAARPTAVLDVGGGSTELAIGVPGEGVTWATSIPVGSGVLADTHLRLDPPSGAEIDALRHAARAAFAGLEPPHADLAVAVGGSATSLARLAGPVLDAEALGAALLAVVADRGEVVARRHALDPERVRLLPAGLAILAQAARVIGAPLAVAQGGLREGVLLSEGSYGQGGRRPAGPR